MKFFLRSEPAAWAKCIRLAISASIARGLDLPYRHVFCSRDMGTTWEDIDGGALPNVVFYAAAYETHTPYRLFVPGDTGVWALTQGKWLNISGNLSSVVVSDLVYHHRSRTLTAATYGRGVWRIRARESG